MAKSECVKCGLTFSSTSAFDMHRTGSYGDPIYDKSGKQAIAYTKPSRRCLTIPEIQQKGMILNERGMWTCGGSWTFTNVQNVDNPVDKTA